MNNTTERAITERQSKVLVFISDSIKSKGFPPTYREIMDALDMSSTNAVSGHIMALERKGYLITIRSKARAVSLTDKARQFIVSIAQ